MGTGSSAMTKEPVPSATPPICHDKGTRPLCHPLPGYSSMVSSTGQWSLP